MPTYVYKFVDTGETIEVQQGFHDDNLTEVAHPDSGEMLPVKKVFTPVGVTFKGSGFFKTDNRGKKSAPSSSSESSEGTSKTESKSDAKPDSKSDTKSESKSDSKSDSKPSSGSKSEAASKSTSKPSAP